MGNCLLTKTDSPAASPPPRMMTKKSLFRSSVSRFNLSTPEEAKVSSKRGTVSNDAVNWFIDKDKRTMKQASSFMPWIIRRGLRIETVTESTDSVVAFRGEGAVMFCDASGFTRLTESLAQKPNGAELLSQVLNQFYTPLVDLMTQYRGDILKFSGDAMTVLFVAEPDEGITTEYDIPCGSGWARCVGHSELELAVLRATACCIEIHKRLDNFEIPDLPGITLSFHIGVGCGTCVVLHVGGENSPDDQKTKRFEYVLCGDPLEQIAHATKYARIYESVLSPEAWEFVKRTVVEGSPVTEDPRYHRLADLNTSKHSYASIRAAARARDTRVDRFSLNIDELRSAKRYIPSAVFKQMENGTIEYVNEIRTVTVFFVSVVPDEYSADEFSTSVTGGSVKGAIIAQQLMESVQRACFEQEGQVNKFLVDDKGLLFLCVFGTPPMVHTDDPSRAISASFAILAALKRMNLIGYIGMTTGRVFCGLVGSPERQEYTTLGDSVNLAARLMGLHRENKVIVDRTTYEQSMHDFDYVVLESVLVKGKKEPVCIFEPCSKRMTNEQSGSVVMDPLVKCHFWPELKSTQKILTESNLLHSGGVVVIQGNQVGLGRDQLGELILSEATTKCKGKIAKIFSTDLGLHNSKSLPLVELLESCLGVVRSEFGGETDPIEVLAKWAGSSVESFQQTYGIVLGSSGSGSGGNFLGHLEIPALDVGAWRKKGTGTSSIAGPFAGESNDPLESLCIELCETAVKKLLLKQPVILLMKSSNGTSLFNVKLNETFDKLVVRMTALAKAVNVSEPGANGLSDLKPLIVILLDDLSAESARKRWISANPSDHTIIELHTINRDCVEEYVAKLLDLSPDGHTNIPCELVDFLEDLTLGNPLYIRESLEQLMERKYIARIKSSENDEGWSVAVSDNVSLYSDVKLTEWTHTNMVGSVICQLEALDPQAIAIVKMASVFEGPFCVLDLAASLKSPYTDATRFDNYRMYRTCRRLARSGILNEINGDTNAIERIAEVESPAAAHITKFPKETDPIFLECVKSIPHFILDNFLTKRVARGMILQQQATKVKRQALMSRALQRDLPARLKEHKKKLASLDVHYYDLVHLQ